MNKGFTFAEFIIVIVLIGLLATMAIPACHKIQESRAVIAYENGAKLTPKQKKLVQDYYKRIKIKPSASNATSNPLPTGGILIPADQLKEIEVEGVKYYIWTNKP